MTGGFALPAALALAAAWAGAALWSWRHERARRAAALAALGDAALLARVGDLPAPRRRALRVLLRVAAVTLACVALARPQFGDVRGGERTGRDVLVAVDLSRSMTVSDADGARLDRAKAVARDLADRLPGDRLGLVVFGGTAFLQLPLTTDHAVFTRFLDAARPGNLDDPSTNLGAPLVTATVAFAHEGVEGHRALVLISDGEDGWERVAAGVEKVRGAHVPVFAIGVGSLAGGFVPADSTDKGDQGSPWHVDFVGRPVASKLEEDALKRITQETGGRYARWDDAGAVDRLVDGVRAISARPIEGGAAPERREDFQWPLGAAVLLLAVELAVAAAPRRAGRMAAAALVLLAAVSQPACVPDQVARLRAQRAYARGDFKAAREGWRSALSHRDDPVTRYNLGTAEVRLGRFEEAMKSFRAAASAGSPVRAEALYNLGTAAIRAAEVAPQNPQLLDDAVTALDESLVLRPDDRDAKWNLEVALRRRGNRESSGSPGRGGRAQAGSEGGREEGLDSQRETAIGAMAGGGRGNAEGESAQELDPNEARRLLDAIEREQLSSQEGRPGKRGQRHDRDW